MPNWVAFRMNCSYFEMVEGTDRNHVYGLWGNKFSRSSMSKNFKKKIRNRNENSPQCHHWLQRATRCCFYIFESRFEHGSVEMKFIRFAISLLWPFKKKSVWKLWNGFIAVSEDYKKIFLVSFSKEEQLRESYFWLSLLRATTMQESHEILHRAASFSLHSTQFMPCADWIKNSMNY